MVFLKYMFFFIYYDWFTKSINNVIIDTFGNWSESNKKYFWFLVDLNSLNVDYIYGEWLLVRM